ncbi:MAG: hypothetical protein HY248_04695, partial [Fimbriimonas ginsengisoli]|nr:hypothetical protein [Fimbriimonas ginsengisoli]
MIGTIIYLVACFFAAVVLSTMLIVFRPMRSRDDSKPWKTFIFMYLLCLAAPYLYCEGLTRLYGKPMKEAID